jgi:lactoylglutathione lyase
VAVPDLAAALARLAPLGVQPEKQPYRPGGREDLPLIAVVSDPDGYRIELLEGAGFATPQDGPHPSLT